MKKAILVIDTPKSCADCRLKRGLFCGENGNSLYDYIHADESLNDKPSWCPLRQLPQKKSESVRRFDEEIYNSGWNDCLDEILGNE